MKRLSDVLLPQLINEGKSVKKSVRLTMNQLEALNAAMTQGMSYSGHPEWKKTKQDVIKAIKAIEKSGKKNARAKIELPISDDWNNEITAAIEDELGHNNYGMHPDDLIYKVTDDELY